MIIFGWGHQTIKNIGPTVKNLCSHCNNEEYWILTRFMNWFTLFFVPVFPYSIKFFLSCPICQYGLNLEGGQVSTLKPLAEANRLLIEGEITESEYHERLEEHLEPQLRHGEEKVAKKDRTLNMDDEKLSHCAECGAQTTKEIKFCGECGTKVS